MPFHKQSERQEPYFVEIEGVFEPTEEEIERGRRFAEALAQIQFGFSALGIDDQHLKINWSSLNGGRIIVDPAFPITREVVRGDPFYEWTSPNETTRSAAQLVIDHFKLLDPPYGQKLSDRASVEGTSPSYKGPSIPLREVVTFRPVEHQIAVVRRR